MSFISLAEISNSCWLTTSVWCSRENFLSIGEWGLQVHMRQRLHIKYSVEGMFGLVIKQCPHILLLLCIRGMPGMASPFPCPFAPITGHLHIRCHGPQQLSPDCLLLFYCPVSMCFESKPVNPVDCKIVRFGDKECVQRTCSLLTNLLTGCRRRHPLTKSRKG